LHFVISALSSAKAVQGDNW